MQLSKNWRNKIGLSLLFLIFFTYTISNSDSNDSIMGISDLKTMNSEFTYLTDFIGNWSNLESLPANSRFFTNYEINSDIEMFNSPTFELTGNGVLSFNLTTHDYEFNLTQNQSLLFNWMDYGALNDATYIGVVLRFRTESNEITTVYIGKFYSGSYSNTTTSVLKFASPSIELGTLWEQWGIEIDTFLQFWNTSYLTLTQINYIHQSTVSYNGPRFVRYTQPLLVDILPSSIRKDGSFLDIIPANETATTTTTTVETTFPTTTTTTLDTTLDTNTSTPSSSSTESSTTISHSNTSSDITDSLISEYSENSDLIGGYSSLIVLFTLISLIFIKRRKLKA